MKFFYTALFLFAFLFSNAQNLYQGIVVDHEDKKPLEFVNIFNNIDNTISNADGQYAFSSEKDSVLFYHVGYDKFATTFNQLKDTIFLKKSVLELNEVVVTNAKTSWQKFKDSVYSNYKIEPYKERFFLRCILRRNDSIVRIQDMVGKLKRKTLFYPAPLKQGKKDFEIELTNMRKVGIDTDKENVYFIFPSFYETLIEYVRINAIGKDFELEEFDIENKNQTRLNFKKIGPKKIWTTQGHYIFNTLDHAILAFERKITSSGATLKKSRWLRYRTLKSDTKIYFEKNTLKENYFLKTAKNYFVVETLDKDYTFRNLFTMEIILNTFDNFGDFEVKSNINEHKDMFKLKHPYNPNFWKTQNVLLLTDEMKAFIANMGIENNDFKVRSNMN